MNTTLPDYQKKQQLLYADKRTESELIAYGEAFLKTGRDSDALEFFQKANYAAGLSTLKDKAKQTGDAMLLQQACRALQQVASKEDWLLTGQRARELGKYSFAMHAFEKSGHEDLRQEIQHIVKTEEQ